MRFCTSWLPYSVLFLKMQTLNLCMITFTQTTCIIFCAKMETVPSYFVIYASRCKSYIKYLLNITQDILHLYTRNLKKKSFIHQYYMYAKY